MRSKNLSVITSHLSLKFYAKKKSCRKKRSFTRPDLQQRDGDEVYQRCNVGGEKISCRKYFYGAMQKVADKTGEEPLKIFKKAMENVAPTLEVKSRRIGGATYQVPLEVTKDRRNTLAIRWIVTNARKRGEKTMEDRLVGELLDATNNRGNAVKKKDDVHRMADANKAFAHYRF